MGVAEVALLALGVAVVDLLLLTASHPDHKPFCEQECAGPVGGGDTPTGPSSCQWGVDCGACAGVLRQLNNSDFPHLYYMPMALAAVLFPFFIAYWWWLPKSSRNRH
jgi:hypothetical protein